MNKLEFKEVYELYFRDVYKFLLSLCHNEEFAEELTQDTFVKAMQNYDKFRGECKITVWLCQIAKNSFYLHSKQKKQIADVVLNSDVKRGTLALLLKEITTEN